jgi:beta-galactosidase
VAAGKVVFIAKKGYVMFRHFIFASAALLLCHSGNTGSAQQTVENTPPVREKLLFDAHWKFAFGDASSFEGDFGYGSGDPFSKAGQSYGPASPGFDDAKWRVLDLPHDWAVELDFVNVQNDNLKSHGFKPIGREFPRTSIGWYRRAFAIPRSDEGRRMTVQFDGVFRDCQIWLNGHYLGRNLSGYSGFEFDITDYVLYGQKNVLVVRVDVTQAEGWFYEGAGIYRHVWLLKYDPVHIADYGIFIHTTISNRSANVVAQTEIINRRPERALCDLSSMVIDDRGKNVGQVTHRNVQLDPVQHTTVTQNLTVAGPRLWSLEIPTLYRLVSLVKSQGVLLDSVVTVFGIRTVHFDKDKGLFLNGKPVKIKGVCCHQDHAGVGSALPDRLQAYRIERLKEMGCNAYRTSHNPPTIELLEACDRLGMLVMDENRLMGTSSEMMGQFERLILRDRNHPSVILWSLGNEEYLIQGTDVGRRIALSLGARLKQLDPTRLWTYAANNGNQFEGINSIAPVRGFNYMNVSDIDRYRREHPHQILLGSEEASTLCTRGIYANDTVRGYVSDYDRNRPNWGSLAEPWWKFYAAREWLAGAFVWTGFDYRGEPTPYSWPCINSHFGIMDVCGFPKNNYYYYQAWWSDKNVLHLYPHWNWPGKEGQMIDIWAQTNCDSVELFLNGRSFGTRKVEQNSHCEWKVPFEPGTLEARGIRLGKTLKTAVATTGEPARISLTADRRSLWADGEDVCMISVTALDTLGREVPVADNTIRFELKGGGTILGVGNGDPSSHEPDKSLTGEYRRKLFNGRCQVIVQSRRGGGALTIRASSQGLEPALLFVPTELVAPRPSVPPFIGD